MSKDPLVTIGIPTYNRADSYFPGVLQCAVSQSYKNLEIIVSDNCSTDSTEAVVKGFDDPRIRYIKRKVNVPATENFNLILKEVRGDYFSLLHDDDLMDADFIETCMRAAAGNTDIGLIRTGLRWIDNNGQTISEVKNIADGMSLEDFFLAWFAGRIPMHQPSTLFNSRALKDIGGFKSRHDLFNDVMAEVKLAATHSRLDIPDIKASYRHHPVRTTTAVSIRAWCEDSLELFDVIKQLASDKREAIHEEGTSFFVGHNLRLARQIESPLVQIRSYWEICRHFKLPVRFLAGNILYTVRCWIKRKLQGGNTLDTKGG